MAQPPTSINVFHLTGTSRCGTSSSLDHHQEQCPTGDSGDSGNPAWLETLRPTGHLVEECLEFNRWKFGGFHGDLW